MSNFFFINLLKYLALNAFSLLKYSFKLTSKLIKRQ